MDRNNFDFQSWKQAIDRDEEQAAEMLVQAYYDRLVALAQRRLAVLPPQVADDEGAVISALRSFFSGVQDGQFRQLRDQQDLWRLLATMTARKAIRQLRVHWKQSGEAGLIERGASVSELIARRPSPEEDAILIDQCQSCLEAIDDPQLKQIVILRLEGCETGEIAEQLNIHIRSVQRKLKLVEAIWTRLDQQDAPPDSEDDG